MQWQPEEEDRTPAIEQREAQNPQPSDIGIIVWIVSGHLELVELRALRATSRLHMFSVRPRLGEELRRVRQRLHQLQVLLYGIDRAAQMFRDLPRPRR